LSEVVSKDFRATMSQFCTGVVVATAWHEEQPVGLTLQSFVSISLEPLLIAISPGKSSVSWPRIREAGKFCINILAKDQQPICDAMSKSGNDKFERIDWELNVMGFPCFPDSIAGINCEIDDEHDAGDHTIVIGRVLDFDLNKADKEPLVFFRGQYGTFV
jgi:flavin reductase (DIM6/NTAB) family NADH-FMN oxidoreductase RutF